MTNRIFVGWDIGGAHLKYACADSTGRVLDVQQLPCPLWLGIEELAHLLKAILSEQPQLNKASHAITMTGELADCFSSRQQGVESIINCFQRAIGTADFHVFAGKSGLLSAQNISGQEKNIASSNWLVTANYCASQICEDSNRGLLIDIGSTTTDIISFSNGDVISAGITDADRLTTGTLLYTGVARTPVMAFCNRLDFKGQSQSLMAELFATTADVYRLTGELQSQSDQSETADGAGKSAEDSARRIARMLGRDLNEASMEVWRDVALDIAQHHQDCLIQVIKQQLVRNFKNKPASIIVAAGTGRFLIRKVAFILQQPTIDIADLFNVNDKFKELAAQCAPATALAYLLLEISRNITES